jgi:hypothetical protein
MPLETEELEDQIKELQEELEVAKETFVEELNTVAKTITEQNIEITKLREENYKLKQRTTLSPKNKDNAWDQ